MESVKSPSGHFDLIIVGAGMAGLTLATRLSKAGEKVLVLEKAGGSGGRLSSKRVSSGGDEYVSFDLGCASFSAKSKCFQEQVSEWFDEGLAQALSNEAPFNEIVGVPRSSSITRSMVGKLDTSFGARVESLHQVEGGWVCKLEGEGKVNYSARTLILAIPPQQVADLLPVSNINKPVLQAVKMQAQWVLMLTLDAQIDLLSVARDETVRTVSSVQNQSKAIQGIYCDSDKPKRVRTGESRNWVIHASAQWTAEHLELDKYSVKNKLISELERVVGHAFDVSESYAHRWLYSSCSDQLLNKQAFMILDDNLYACGDWLGSSDEMVNEPYDGVESAYLSAVDLAGHLMMDNKG
jgi:predicted NAD/FAD-dependent oxidoreductase